MTLFKLKKTKGFINSWNVFNFIERVHSTYLTLVFAISTDDDSFIIARKKWNCKALLEIMLEQKFQVAMANKNSMSKVTWKQTQNSNYSANKNSLRYCSRLGRNPCQIPEITYLKPIRYFSWLCNFGSSSTLGHRHPPQRSQFLNCCIVVPSISITAISALPRQHAQRKFQCSHAILILWAFLLAVSSSPAFLSSVLIQRPN